MTSHSVVMFVYDVGGNWMLYTADERFACFPTSTALKSARFPFSTLSTMTAIGCLCLPWETTSDLHRPDSPMPPKLPLPGTYVRLRYSPLCNKNRFGMACSMPWAFSTQFVGSLPVFCHSIFLCLEAMHAHDRLSVFARHLRWFVQHTWFQK